MQVYCSFLISKAHQKSVVMIKSEQDDDKVSPIAMRGLKWDCFGPSVDDQAVRLSDDGTTIIIDFFSFFSLLSPPSLFFQKGLL